MAGYQDEKSTLCRVGPATQAQSPVTIVANVLEQAREMAARVQGLADRMLGCTPELDGANAMPSPSGVLTELAATAERTRDYISDANRALSRIESALS